jgi:UDP-2-acetamido-3-amino-2,3-dideoxy-glucuronate N-acetyltransferase
VQTPVNEAPFRQIHEVAFGEDVIVHPFTNLYGCEIGDRSRIGPFVEIQAGARIGSDCKIQSHSFICDGVEIGDRVFVGHGVIFCNDRRPRATGDDGRALGPDDWELERTAVADGASIGSRAVILGGIRVGERALIGAGAVVTRDVPAGTTIVGNPGRPLPRD